MSKLVSTPIVGLTELGTIESGGARFSLQDEQIVRIFGSGRDYSATLFPLLTLSPPKLQKNESVTSMSAQALEEFRMLTLEMAKIELKIKLTKPAEGSPAEGQDDKHLVMSVKRVRKPFHRDTDLSVKAFDADLFEFGIVDAQGTSQLLKIQRVCVVLNHQQAQGTSIPARYFVLSKHLELEGVDIHVPNHLEEMLSSMRLLFIGLLDNSESGPSEIKQPLNDPKHHLNPAVYCTPIPECSLRYEQSSSPLLRSGFDYLAEDQSIGGNSDSQPAVWGVFSAHKTRDSLFRDKLTVLVKNLKLTLSDNPLEVSLTSHFRRSC